MTTVFTCAPKELSRKIEADHRNNSRQIIAISITPLKWDRMKHPHSADLRAIEGYTVTEVLVVLERQL